MHPDLLNNATFLRYYARWQADPTSAAFVGVADYFREYRLYDDALRVCTAGLQQNPDLLSGHLVLARIYIDLQRRPEAEAELHWVLTRAPHHPDARRWLAQIGGVPPSLESPAVPEGAITADTPAKSAEPTVPSDWATMTMARLYERQGHRDQAAAIYRQILRNDPTNAEAQQRLDALAGSPE